MASDIESVWVVERQVEENDHVVGDLGWSLCSIHVSETSARRQVDAYNSTPGKQPYRMRSWGLFDVIWQREHDA